MIKLSQILNEVKDKVLYQKTKDAIDQYFQDTSSKSFTRMEIYSYIKDIHHLKTDMIMSVLKYLEKKEKIKCLLGSTRDLDLKYKILK